MKKGTETNSEKRYICPQCRGKVTIKVSGMYIESYCPSCDRNVVAKTTIMDPYDK